MEIYRRRTGERMTYETLATRTGLAKTTLESLASRRSYNPRLSTVEKICRVLRCTPGELLELPVEGDQSDAGEWT
ncbi:MAG TPA: helix-turn-helix transcriptional regulator [Candidatus Defluviicoccus seviourii]|nr:helix-turn-helix transcriptional regulator [Candidatus Defluviicoccus seviourii]